MSSTLNQPTFFFLARSPVCSVQHCFRCKWFKFQIFHLLFGEFIFQHVNRFKAQREGEGQMYAQIWKNDHKEIGARK